MENVGIQKGIAKYKLGLKVLIGIQVFILLMLLLCFEEFRLIISIFAIAAFVYGDMLYWVIYIRKLKKLLYVRPVKCVVEDMIVTSYRRDNKTHYNLTFLLRGLDDGNLYYTYGRHKIAFYTTVNSSMNKSLLEICAIRKDRTPVNLGDMVYIYINQFINIPVDVDRMTDTVKLDGETYMYRHINANYDASVFESVYFFDGAVDIETEI